MLLIYFKIYPVIWNVCIKIFPCNAWSQIWYEYFFHPLASHGSNFISSLWIWAYSSTQHLNDIVCDILLSHFIQTSPNALLPLAESSEQAVTGSYSELHKLMSLARQPAHLHMRGPALPLVGRLQTTGDWLSGNWCSETRISLLTIHIHCADQSHRIAGDIWEQETRCKYGFGPTADLVICGHFCELRTWCGLHKIRERSWLWSPILQPVGLNNKWSNGSISGQAAQKWDTHL